MKSYTELSSRSGLEGVTIHDGGMLGWGVAALGDLDGDKVVVSLHEPLSLLVVLLNSDGSTKHVVWNTPQTLSSRRHPVGGNDYFGMGVEGLGDLDGDGVNDVAVGRHRAIRPDSTCCS